MPSTGTHRYGSFISPIARGTIVVNGTLTLPTGTDKATFNMGPSTYYEAGIYTLISYITLAGGTVVANFQVDDTALPSGLTAGTPYQDGSSIKVVVS
jgi:hypothetical protein